MVDPVSAAGPASPAAARAAGVHPDGAARPPDANHHRSFRAFLSELNPLQYIPVIGTLYRAFTGDTIPEVAREVGSMVFSGLTGGPIGVAINVASLAVEKVAGFDPEKIGQSVLARIGIGGSASPPQRVAARAPGAALAASSTAAASGAFSTPAALAASSTPAALGASSTVAGAPAGTGPGPAQVAAGTNGFALPPALTETAISVTAATAVMDAAAAASDPAAVAWSPAQLTAYGITMTTAGDMARGALQGSDVLNELELGRHRQVETA